MITHHHVRAAIVALAALALAAGCSSGTTSTASSSTTAAGSSPGSTPGSTAPAVVSSAKHGVGHVWIIVLENKNYAATFGKDSPATYLNGTLVPKGKMLTQYYATGHNSLDNYISMVSGQAPNPKTQGDCVVYSDFEMTGTAEPGQAVGAGCVYPKEVTTIADQLQGANLSWKGYFEDMGNDPSADRTCRHPKIGEADPTEFARKGDEYAAKHVPFVYFHSIIDAPVCKERVVGLDALDKDLAAVDTTPAYNFISPNLCHDGHDHPCASGEPGGLTSADAFLSTWVPKILASPAFELDGALIVTFDESEGFGDDGDSTSCCGELPGPNVDKPGLTGPGGGRVGAVVVSPLAKPNTTDPTPYNHYSLLCSVEELFDLPKLGMAGQKDLACFGSGAAVFDDRQKG